jgi:hypothetical protein
MGNHAAKSSTKEPVVPPNHTENFLTLIKLGDLDALKAYPLKEKLTHKLVWDQMQSINRKNKDMNDIYMWYIVESPFPLTCIDEELHAIAPERKIIKYVQAQKKLYTEEYRQLIFTGIKRHMCDLLVELFTGKHNNPPCNSSAITALVNDAKYFNTGVIHTLMKVYCIFNKVNLLPANYITYREYLLSMPVANVNEHALILIKMGLLDELKKLDLSELYSKDVYNVLNVYDRDEDINNVHIWLLNNAGMFIYALCINYVNEFKSASAYAKTVAMYAPEETLINYYKLNEKSHDTCSNKMVFIHIAIIRKFVKLLNVVINSMDKIHFPLRMYNETLTVVKDSFMVEIVDILIRCTSNFDKSYLTPEQLAEYKAYLASKL